jgi:photosystem II stability/assembly factor-like uncharacterized protein
MKRKLILVLIVFTLPAYAQQHGWVRVAQVGDQFTNLWAVEFTDSLHGWLYGSRVNYMYTIDGGANWHSAVSAGFAATSISMLDTIYGWTTGNGVNEGGIGKTTDGGRTWIQQRRRLDRAYVGTASLNRLKNITSGYTRVIGFPDTGKVVRTTNGGATWAETSMGTSPLGKVVFVDSIHGWITTNGNVANPAVFRTTDGGVTWATSVPPQGLKAISFIDTLNGWGVIRATFYRTTDGGQTWQFLTFINTGDSFGATALSFVDSLNGWAFGGAFYQGIDTEAIYRTTDGGHSWVLESIGLTPDFGDISDGKMIDLYHGWAVCGDGSVLRYQIVTDVAEKLPGLPKEFSLRQNYPNPFNPQTAIEYELSKKEFVSLKVHDITGRTIQTLVNQAQEAGVYRVRFDGSRLPTGVYYYTLGTNQFTATKAMNLVK